MTGENVRRIMQGRAAAMVRVLKGWSQKELAERALIDPSYVSLFERGMRSPSQRVIRHIAEALEVSSTYLIGLSFGEDVGRQTIELVQQELLKLEEEHCDGN